MSSSARKRRIPPLRRRVPLPTAAKEPKRRFLRPLWREIPSGGQNLSGVSPSFRATGPWRGGGLGLPLPLGPPGLCHAVWLGGGPRAGGDTGPYAKAAVLGVGADTIRPPYPDQLLRLLVPGALSPSSRTVFLDCPASGSGGEAGAISCTARAGCEERPPQKENSAAPAAGSFAHGGKGTKTPFFAAPLAGNPVRRAKFEWRVPLLPGHWALAWRRIGPAAPTGAAWPVPCCLAGQLTAGRWGHRPLLRGCVP